MEKGKLIVFEGACDGIGKSTQYELLKQRLESDGNKVVYHHFPTYDEYQGECAVKYLKGEFGDPSKLSPYFIHSLYAIDRAITWHTKLKEEYEKGSIILLDRYTTSSLIYQASVIENQEEKDKFLAFAMDYEYNKLGIKEPDEVIFLTAPFEIVTELRNSRKNNDGVVNDIHESNIEYLKKAYNNALYVAKFLNFSFIECTCENEMRSIQDIHEDICRLVLK